MQTYMSSNISCSNLTKLNSIFYFCSQSKHSFVIDKIIANREYSSCMELKQSNINAVRLLVSLHALSWLLIDILDIK